MTGPGTTAAPSAGLVPTAPRQRRFLMCPPRHFEVTYAINPWMDPDQPTDPQLAASQWRTVVDAYEGLGHEVLIVEPVPGLPDMVFTANIGFSLGDTVLLSRFRHAERHDEIPAARAWFEAHGWRSVHQAAASFEGEGDAVLVGDRIVAAVGPRTDREAHEELAEAFGLPVVSLELADPRWYHLDTAFAAVTDDLVAWYPRAFTPDSQRIITSLFPQHLVASEHDAGWLGVNLVSDGHNVLVARQAERLIGQLERRGLVVHPVDVSEFRKSGGGIKCVTLDLHAGS
ncbi:MAG: arginine deiminase family protein [Nitriliruptorales bacterium]|nr:arginine deiminase family protein [Nitriliruptorales bacterium]